MAQLKLMVQYESVLCVVLKREKRPWMSVTFLRLDLWYQSAQRITYRRNTLIYGLNFVL